MNYDLLLQLKTPSSDRIERIRSGVRGQMERKTLISDHQIASSHLDDDRQGRT